MSKLRVSSHRLSIEPGRWSKPNLYPISGRNWLFCNLYNTLRKLYIPKYYRKCSNMLKIYELINAGNSKVLKNHSIFIYKAFESRNSTIYVDNRN